MLLYVRARTTATGKVAYIRLGVGTLSFPPGDGFILYPRTRGRVHRVPGHESSSGKKQAYAYGVRRCGTHFFAGVPLSAPCAGVSVRLAAPPHPRFFVPHLYSMQANTYAAPLPP